MTSLHAYGTDNVDNHHFVSSKQQPVVFESATRSVRQEDSSEAPPLSDAFAPFLGSVWEFHYLNSDKSIGELIGTFTFDDATHTENGETELYVISDNSGRRCDNGPCHLIYYSTGTPPFYALQDIHFFFDYFAGKSIGGHTSLFVIHCATPTCDVVTGTNMEDSWTGEYTEENISSYKVAFVGQRLSASSLPLLGGIALDVNETTIPTETIYLGGISVNGGSYQTQVVQNLADQVDILGNIMVDPRHVGQTADIFVFAKATLPSSEEVSYFALGQGLSILPLDKNTDLTAVPAFQADVILEANQVVQIYQGTFFYPGTLKVRFGYELKDGSVVMSAQTIDITINQ